MCMLLAGTRPRTNRRFCSDCCGSPAPVLIAQVLMGVQPTGVEWVAMAVIIIDGIVIALTASEPRTTDPVNTNGVLYH